MQREEKTRMARWLLLPSLALAACGDAGTGSTSPVTQVVRHMEAGVAPAGADLGPSAIDYVLARADDLDAGLSTGDDYQVLRETTTPGMRHLRLQQVHSGVPVHGSELVVHADDSAFLGFNGHLTRNLDGFDTGPEITADDAIAIARLDRSGGDEEVMFIRESSGLVILPRAEGGADLAWQVHLANAGSSTLEPGAWAYFVDASSGAIARKYDTLPREEQASGPGGAQSGGWDLELDVEYMWQEVEGGVVWMKTDRLETYDLALHSENAVWGLVEEMPNALANDAHGFAEVTLDMMRDWYGFDSVDDAGRIIESYVNDDTVCPAGSACAPLEGEARVYYTVSWPEAAQSLGVVAHEINHNFTEFHSNLTYSGEGAQLHEHFSAVAQASVEFYEWGSDVSGKLSQMCSDEPSGIGVPNRAFCLAIGRYRVSIGGSATAAVRGVSQVWYQANAAYWTPSTDFLAACQGTIDAAQSLGLGSDFVQGLRDSWADVDVDCGGPGSPDSFVCDLDDECDADAGETCASCPDDCGACSEECSLWKKAKCKLGIGDCSKCDASPDCGDGVCDGYESDDTCGEDCGCAADDSCTVAPFGCWCDPTCLELGDCCADIANFCQ